jgi:type IV fimbrial biogenesis protein FimT
MVARPTDLPRQRGFTLPEALTVVAIMAILGALAAPSFTTLISNQRARAASSELFASLNRARSEAIKRNTEVSLVPGPSGNWQDGWSIPNPVDTGHPVQVSGALKNLAVSGPGSVVYLPNGRVKGTEAPSFDIAFDNLAKHRCVQVDLSGRPYQKSEAC